MAKRRKRHKTRKPDNLSGRDGSEFTSTKTDKIRIVHVPVVHGIGVTSMEEWARESVALLVDYLKLTGKYGWEVQGCESGYCTLESTTGHRHLISPAFPGVRVDVEPVFWSDLVEPRNFLVMMWWAFHSTIQVFIVHFASAIFHAGTLMDRSARQNPLGLRTRWRLYLRVLALGVLGLPAAVIAALLMLSPKMRRRSRDALAWTTDSSLRTRIQEFVGSRIRWEESHSQVLVGHSQGGSILTTLAASQKHPSRISLMTLGNGQGLLATLNAIPRRHRFLIILLQVIQAAYLLENMMSMTSLVRSFLLLVATTWHSLTSIGAAVWFAGITLETAPILLVPALQETSEYLQTLPETAGTSIAWIVLSMPSLVVITLLVRTFHKQLHRTGETVVAACRPNVRGLDLSAEHDYVSSLMSILGAPTRFRKIPQAGSFPMDHLTYFRNGQFALAPIVHAIEEHASGRYDITWPETDSNAAKAHKDNLRTRGWKLAWMTLLCLIPSLTLLAALPPWLALLAAIGVLCLVMVIRNSTMLALLNENWGRPQTGTGSLTASGARRANLGSVKAAVGYALASLPFLGLAGNIFGSNSASLKPLIATTSFEQVITATLAAGMIIVAAFTRREGIRSSLYMAATGFSLGALTWVVQNNTFAMVMSAVYGTGAVLALARLRRVNKQQIAATQR